MRHLGFVGALGTVSIWFCLGLELLKLGNRHACDFGNRFQRQISLNQIAAAGRVEAEGCQ